MSYPIIKLTPQTVNAVKFQINDTIVTLNVTSDNTNKEITINCESEEVYDVRSGAQYNLFSIYSSNSYYEFPNFKPFVNNTFKLLSGNVSHITIDHNDRWI